MKKLVFSLAMCSSLFFLSCSDDDDTPDVPVAKIDSAVVVANYADIVMANYSAAMVDAQALETAITTFVAEPTETNFTAAKTAWFTARETYGTTEAFRFANGPIDSGETEDIEGFLNSWPLDEAYIDYVDGDATAGIINDLTAFPILTKEILTGENGNGGEENVAIGYHAIEFLLWGQDLTAPSENLPGQRAYTDFVDGGTAANQARRREYLAIVADLLTDHLQVVIDTWSNSYKATFLGLDQKVALTNIINSISELSRSELAIERINVALVNKSQEDEHSCFSDNTNRDVRLNLQGIVNVYKGTYGNVKGISLEDLIKEADPALAAELSTLLAAAETKLEATLDPFDLAIADGETSTEGAKVKLAVQALVAFGDKLLEAKSVLEIN